MTRLVSHAYCESWGGFWLQGEAALQTHHFRDVNPQPVSLAVIPQNKEKIIMDYPPSS